MKQTSKSIENIRNFLTMNTEKPYLLRTRLEREFVNMIDYSKEYNFIELNNFTNELFKKIKYVSDLSTQSSSGVSNLFYVIKDDLNNLIEVLERCE